MAVNRRCARPQCALSAAATLSYAYDEQSVWLVALADEAHPMTHDLCQRHADNLAVPRGWIVRDERTAPLPLSETQQLLSA